MGGACHAQLHPPSTAAPLPSTTLSAPATLRAAAESAWLRAPSAREAAGERQRAEAQRAAAERLWAAPPALELSHRDDRWQTDAGRRETEVGIAWPLWLPGQRSAHSAVADTATVRAAAGERVARLHVAGLVRETAWSVVAQQADVAQTADRVTALRRLADDVERRVRAGDLARADALAARAEWLAARGGHAEAQQRLEAARIRWTELTGLKAMPNEASIVERVDLSGASPLHPEVSLARETVEHARRRLELVRASRRDAPELKVGMRRDVSGGIEGTNNSLTVGIRVPFGTVDRNQPLEVAAFSDVDIADSTAQRLQARVQADVASARSALESAERQLAVERERATLLRERATLIDRSFRAGESALPELLRALTAAAQADNAAARQAVALGLARARYQQAAGILP